MKPERDYWLPRLSVDRPVTVVMVLTAVLVVGAIAYTRIPLELFPSGMQWPQLWVWTSYPNASPLEVEQKIAKPLEEAIATVSRVGKIESGSYNGYCWVRVEFLKGTDIKEAFAELKDRMDRVMPELPEEVERIGVRRWDENDIEIIWGAFTFAGDFSDKRFLLDTYVEPALRRIEGVGDVGIWGGRSRQVIIDVDQGKVLSHKVNLFEMVGKLRSQNLTVPGGSVLEGGRKIYVRSLGKYQTVEEIRDIVIKSEGRVRLGDVAQVELRRPKQDWIYRIDGKGAMGFEVRRNANANVVNISKEVRQTLDELARHPKLEGIGYQIFFDQGKYVTQSVDNLKASGLWGGLFAALVLFFFFARRAHDRDHHLGHSSVVVDYGGLPLFYRLVAQYGDDDGIDAQSGVGGGQCHCDRRKHLSQAPGGRRAPFGFNRRRRRGRFGHNYGYFDHGGCVFLPLMLMSGEEDMAFWMLRIGLPVIIGLLASLLIALIFIPLAAQRLSSKAVREKGELGFILWLRKFYVRTLTWVLGHRTDAFILVLAVMATIQIPMDGMQRADKKNNEGRDLRLRFEMPTGQELEKADVFMSGVEDTLLNHREEYNLRALRTEFWRSAGVCQYDPERGGDLRVVPGCLRATGIEDGVAEKTVFGLQGDRRGYQEAAGYATGGHYAGQPGRGRQL